jgi:hypothetical protein
MKVLSNRELMLFVLMGNIPLTLHVPLLQHSNLTNFKLLTVLYPRLASRNQNLHKNRPKNLPLSPLPFFLVKDRPLLVVLSEVEDLIRAKKSNTEKFVDYNAI